MFPLSDVMLEIGLSARMIKIMPILIRNYIIALLVASTFVRSVMMHMDQCMCINSTKSFTERSKILISTRTMMENGDAEARTSQAASTTMTNFSISQRTSLIAAESAISISAISALKNIELYDKHYLTPGNEGIITY